MVNRTSRKSFIKRNGIENYGFDFDKQLNRYRFLCGEKLSIKQWKELDENDKVYTYDAWKLDIRKKYDSYTIGKLKEFSRYLNHCQRSISSIKEFVSIFISVMFTVALTSSVSEFIEITKQEKLAVGILFECIAYIIFFVGIAFLTSYIIFSGINLFSDKNIKNNFYIDFKEIIDELIKEKSKE